MANVCTKGGVEYATINEAVKAEGQDVIKLLTAVNEDVVIPQRRYATIDLNGQTLTCVKSHAIEVERKGTLTVMSSTGKGTVDCIVNAKAALYIGPGASATIEAGTFTRSKEDSKNGSNTWYVIQNHGSLVIDGTASVNGSSTFTSAVENGFDSGRQADMDAFNTMGDSEYVATLTVNDGVIASNKISVKNDEHATCIINGGTLRCTQNPITNWSPLTINGGTITTAGSETAILNGSYNGSQGNATINGGTINAKSGDGQIIAFAEGYASGATYTVKGGTFSKAPAQEYCAPGVSFVTDADGKITASSSVWKLPDGGAVGLGFNGLRRLVMKAETVSYPAGGIDIPMGFDPVGILGVSMTGGAMGYIDRANRKVLLYTANGKEASGNITDVSIVLIGH